MFNPSETPVIEQKSAVAPPSAEAPVLTLPDQPEVQAEPAAPTVNPEDDFAQKRAEYTGLTPEQITQVLERYQGDFLPMPPGEAAALLLLSKDFAATELTQPLEQRVMSDETAANLYYTERLKGMDASQLRLEIATLDTSLQNGTEVPPKQLQALLDTIPNRQQDLEPLIQADPNLQVSIDRLQENWQTREQKLANITNDIENLTEENATEVIPENSEITNVQNTGTEIITTIRDPQTKQEKQVKLQEKDMFGTTLILLMADAMLGTNNMEKLIGMWMHHKVVTPTLLKIGITPPELQGYMGESTRAFDGLLKTMDNAMCEHYFANALDKQYLVDALRQIDQRHLQKIFSAAGTQPFGSSGFFSFDHLQLSQELVDRMYDSLSETERKQFNIPEHNQNFSS